MMLLACSGAPSSRSGGESSTSASGSETSDHEGSTEADESGTTSASTSSTSSASTSATTYTGTVGGTTEALDLPPADDCPSVRVSVPAGDTLNVRADPSTANAPIGSLPNDAIVEKLAEVRGEPVDGEVLWFRVRYLDSEGYISAIFAECTLEDAPELYPPAGFYLPLECGTQVTVTQGNNGTLSHNGLHAYAFDFGVGLDTPLVAMADGIVSLTFDETMPGDPCYDGGGPECGPYGNLVILLHGDGSTSLYKHLNEVQVSIGEFVPQGSTVGLSGSTGYSTGRHAHVMRMEYCGELTCQSIPLEFVEAGVPVTGQVVTSENCPDRD